MISYFIRAAGGRSRVRRRKGVRYREIHAKYVPSSCSALFSVCGVGGGGGWGLGETRCLVGLAGIGVLPVFQSSARALGM